MLASFKNAVKNKEILETLREDVLILEATSDDIARSLHSLIKNNNGLFKSERQSHFIRGAAQPTSDDSFDDERGDHILKQAGVHIDKNKHSHVLNHRQFINFNPYSYSDGARAGRGGRYSHHVFLLDKHGVQAHYKLGMSGDDYDPKKTKKTWERPANVHTGGEEHHYKADEEPLMVSKHLGSPGEKITHNVNIERIHNLGPSKFGGTYGRPGPDQFMTVMKTDDGHIIHHYGTPPASLKGYRFGDKWAGEVTAEVKKHHIDRNNNNVTIVTRPKFTVTSKPEEKQPDFPSRHDL